MVVIKSLYRQPISITEPRQEFPNSITVYKYLNGSLNIPFILLSKLSINPEYIPNMIFIRLNKNAEVWLGISPLYLELVNSLLDIFCTDKIDPVIVNGKSISRENWLNYYYYIFSIQDEVPVENLDNLKYFVN